MVTWAHYGTSTGRRTYPSRTLRRWLSGWLWGLPPALWRQSVARRQSCLCWISTVSKPSKALKPWKYREGDRFKLCPLGNGWDTSGKEEEKQGTQQKHVELISSL